MEILWHIGVTPHSVDCTSRLIVYDIYLLSHLGAIVRASDLQRCSVYERIHILKPVMRDSLFIPEYFLIDNIFFFYFWNNDLQTANYDVAMNIILVFALLLLITSYCFEFSTYCTQTTSPFFQSSNISFFFVTAAHQDSPGSSASISTLATASRVLDAKTAARAECGLASGGLRRPSPATVPWASRLPCARSESRLPVIQRHVWTERLVGWRRCRLTSAIVRLVIQVSSSWIDFY